MLSFQQFILEQSVSDQLKRVGLAVSIEMPDNRYIYESDYKVAEMFKLITKEDKNIQPQDIPVFNYANWKVEKMVKDGWNPELIYNKVEAKERVSSKADWHKLHESSKFTPNVAYDKKGLKNLAYPIIAKPDNRYAGQGIVVFKSEEDLTDAKLEEFSVFSEKIDIKNELRVFCWRGKPLMQVNRIPANEETKKLTKKADDKLKFNYQLQSEGVSEGLDDLIKEFSKVHEDLDFYSIDVAMTEEGPFVIEMSSEPGPCFGIMGHVYKEIYEDFYGEALSPEAQAKVDEYIKEDINQTIESDKDRFSVK